MIDLEKSSRKELLDEYKRLMLEEKDRKENWSLIIEDDLKEIIREKQLILSYLSETAVS